MSLGLPDHQHRCGTVVRRRTPLPHRCSSDCPITNIDVAWMFAESRRRTSRGRWGRLPGA